MKYQIALFSFAALVAVLLVGCAPVPSEVQQPSGATLPPQASATEVSSVPADTVTATELPVTAASTATPPATSAATPAAYPGINIMDMVDQTNGWAFDPDGKLYKTADGGVSWYLVSLPQGITTVPYGGSFLNANEAWLRSSDSNGTPGLFHTTDGGTTWAPLAATGLGAQAGQAGFDFHSPKDGIATVTGAGAGNLYLQEFETHDGGASFKVIPLKGLTDEQGLPEGTVHLCNICVDSFYYDSSRAIIVEGDMATMQPRGGVHVHLSTDLGQHWSEAVLPLPAGYEDALVGGLRPTFPQGSHGFLPVRLLKYKADGTPVYDAIAIYETSDGGATWDLTPTVLSAVNPSLLHILDDLDAVALCGSNICASHNAAHDWQTITPNINLANTETRYVMEMDFVDPLRGWIIISDNGHYLLYQTIDGGSTWKKLTP